MSDTWLCNDTNLNRRVVIKSLKPGISKAKLLDELSALSSIRSRHVVQVLDVIRDSHGEIHAFVEEFIEGPVLLHGVITDPMEALKTLHSIASGIADIHAHGRLHRDIKPDNMKFDGEGTLKVFDFGLSKIDGTGGTSVLFFSEGFTAPEAFKKNSAGVHEYNQAIDTFAFGATALWLLNNGVLPSEFSTLPPTVPATGCDFGAIGVKLPDRVVAALNSTLSDQCLNRPSMAEVRDVLAQHLLQGRHRMLLALNGQDYWLDSSNKKTNLTYAGSSIAIEYDGFEFIIRGLSGHVEVNNIVAQVGMILSGASVIVISAANGSNRASITADVSHPEVIQ